MLKGGFNIKGKLIKVYLKRNKSLLILPLLLPLLLLLLPLKRFLPLI
jgi:hypothetical protein